MSNNKPVTVELGFPTGTSWHEWLWKSSRSQPAINHESKRKTDEKNEVSTSSTNPDCPDEKS